MANRKDRSQKQYIRKILEVALPFLLATLLWLIIVGNDTYTIVIETPIEVYDPRPDKILKNEIPKTAMVRFNGKGRNLLVVKYFDLPKMILDIGTIQQYYKINLSQYYEKYPNRIIFPRDLLSFQEIVYPDSIDVYIDDKITRTMNVKANYNLKVMPGHLLVDQISTDPVSVEITGPQSLVTLIQTVDTDLFTMQDASQGFSEVVRLVNPDPHFFTINPSQVMIGGHIESIGERIITDIPVHITDPPLNQKIQITPEKVSLKVVGGNNLIQKLTADDIQVNFNYGSEWIPNKLLYTPSVKVPNAVLEWRDLNPSTVEIVIVK